MTDRNTTTTTTTNTPQDYAELLKARGDVPISIIRQIHAQLTDLLALVDNFDDNVFGLPKATGKGATAIAAALRAAYPEFADKTDAEVLAHFDVTLPD